MKMNLLLGEAEEPPSRQTATSQLSTKPHRLISPHSPALPPLGAVVTRLERFPIGPATRAFRKRFYPEVEADRVERLALAGAQAHPHARRARAALRAVRRRARRGGAPSRIAAARHHAVLREPDEPRRRARAAAPHAYPGRHRISQDARRGRRSARRGRPYARCQVSCTAIPTACCSWPPASARPIAAIARARAWSASPAATIPSAARNGRRRSITSPRIPRFATC